MLPLINYIIIVFVLVTTTKSDDESSCDAMNIALCTQQIDEKSRILSLVEIDINEYIKGNEMEKKSIANILDEQLHKIGMFRIKNHGLSVDVRNDLFAEMSKFFQSTNEIKSNYLTNGALGENGWEPLGRVNVNAAYNSSSKPDPVESLIIWYVQIINENDPNQIYKYCPPTLCEVIMRFHQKATTILPVIHDIFTLALDLKINQFAIDRTDINNTNIDNHYFNEFRFWNFLDLHDDRLMEEADDFSNAYRFGSHSDFSGFNLVRSDGEGFQVRLDRIDDKWYTVNNDDISEDSIIVILGEVMEMYTSGYWLAPKHRVSRISKKRRMTVSDFFGPNMDRIIHELNDCTKCKENRNHTIMDKYQLPTPFRNHARRRFGASFKHDSVLPFWL